MLLLVGLLTRALLRLLLVFAGLLHRRIVINRLLIVLLALVLGGAFAGTLILLIAVVHKNLLMWNKKSAQ
ncbi:MAG: hypothetical protein K2Q97_08810 [Burkholderiaceae bacterium]|nr:hypothetical protein [Burkholderiaceae bacterium]